MNKICINPLPNRIAFYDEVCRPYFDEKAVELCRSGLIEECYFDDLSFFPTSIIENVFREVSLTSYAIKLFHATRSDCVSQYFEKGFVGRQKKGLNNYALRVFNDVPNDTVCAAIELENGHDEDGFIWFTTNIRYLQKFSGHYLVRGSEYIQRIAMNLDQIIGNHGHYFERLKCIGVPTIFEIHFPISDLSVSDQDVIARMAIAYYANKAMGNKEKPGLIGGVRVLGYVDKKHIVSHSHPRRIPDPHEKPKLYKVPMRKCDYCTK